MNDTQTYEKFTYLYSVRYFFPFVADLRHFRVVSMTLQLIDFRFRFYHFTLHSLTNRYKVFHFTYYVRNKYKLPKVPRCDCYLALLKMMFRQLIDRDGIQFIQFLFNLQKPCIYFVNVRFLLKPRTFVILNLSRSCSAHRTFTS